MKNGDASTHWCDTEREARDEAVAKAPVKTHQLPMTAKERKAATTVDDVKKLS
jgi:hypothetical protein